MLKVDQTKLHIVNIIDTRNGNTMTYTTKNDPQTSVRGVIKTIRNLQNKKTDAEWLLTKYEMFLNTPAEKLAITITQHYNFVFANPIVDPVRRSQVINEAKQRQQRYTIDGAEKEPFGYF
jgi:hypothetical protein